MGWTVEQVLSLAPDPASASAGRGLANAAKWQSVGQSEQAAWGEAKGSGAKPYQVTVALSDGASKCSCPSRKFPCKHALGLFLRVSSGEVPTGEAPSWATEWLEKRGQRAAAKAEKAEVPAATPDPKTAERRWINVLKGLEECEAFLLDAVGNGLLSLSSARSWDDMAKRMVDAQAPGVARRLREIGSQVGVGPDWAPRVSARLGSLGLLIEASRRVDALGDLAHDVRSALGIPTRKEDAQETVTDVWDCLGTFGDEEDRLWTRRTWLRGRETGRWALHLAFGPGGATIPPPLLPFGAAFAAQARFSPSAWPLRAEFDGAQASAFRPALGGTWAQTFDEQAEALARNPWIDLFPVLLTDAVLAPADGGWLVVDAEGMAMPLKIDEANLHWLLGRTGNEPSELFGEFDGERLAVISYRDRREEA